MGFWFVSAWLLLGSCNGLVWVLSEGRRDEKTLDLETEPIMMTQKSLCDGVRSYTDKYDDLCNAGSPTLVRCCQRVSDTYSNSSLYKIEVWVR